MGCDPDLSAVRVSAMPGDPLTVVEIRTVASPQGDQNLGQDGMECHEVDDIERNEGYFLSF